MLAESLVSDTYMGVGKFIILIELVGGVFGYSKISSQDVDRGYTRESTVSDVKRAEMLKLDSSFKPKVNYMNSQTEVLY